jgi:hypothetical protein
MIGTHTRMIVSLTPTRLRGAIVRAGRIVRAEEIELDPTQNGAAWEEGLVSLDRPLRQLLVRLSPGRSAPRITVMYQGARMVAQTHEITGTPDDARRAALLKVRDAHGDGCLSEAEIIAPSARKPGSSIVLTLTDRDQDTAKIFAWISRCGGRLEAVVPEVSTVMRSAVDRVAASSVVETCCYIGPYWSAIACGSAEGLLLVRAFEFGYRNLSDVFLRAMSGGAPAEDANAGEVALFEHGLPFKASQIDPELRARVLPLVAPVLQRFCVEIKQTLRFGVPAEQLPSAITIEGPGAAIAHIAPALTEAINMHVRPSPCVEGARPLEPFGPGTLESDWFAHTARGIRMVPPAAIEQRGLDLINRGLLVGVVAGAAVLGLEFASVRAADRSLDPEFERHAASLAALSREEDVRGRIGELAELAAGYARSVSDASLPGVDWRAVLTLVAESTGDDIFIDEIEARTTPEGGELRLRGTAEAGSDADASDAVAGIVQRFQRSPLVLEVQLGATSRDQRGDDTAVRTFALTLRVRPSTPEHLEILRFAEKLAAAEEEQ